MMKKQNEEYLGMEGYALMGAAFEVHGELKTELKAVKELTSEHEQQLLNYMRITKKAVGYLINFGPMKQLEWKRFVIREYIPRSHK
jgi:GxxExxY protein